MRYLLIFTFSLLTTATAFAQIPEVQSAQGKLQGSERALGLLGRPQPLSTEIHPLGNADVADFRQEPISISVLSEKDMAKLYKLIQATRFIPFQYVIDGCFARAHEIARILDRMQITSGKIFIEGQLRVQNPSDLDQEIRWSYHVASFVMVQTENGPAPYVIDPSLFNEAVPVEVWKNKMTDNPQALYFTKRFIYLPGHRTQDLNDYNIDDVAAAAFWNGIFFTGQSIVEDQARPVQ